MRPARHRSIVVAALVASVLAGCAGPGASGVPTTASTQVPPTDPPVELTVFGASSLQRLLGAAKAAYEIANPDITIVISTESSATLATQIEQGAPADLFLAADTASPQRLFDGGFAAAEPVPFATNLLAIIVPIGNPAAIETPFDLAGEGVRIVAAGESVPITTYARELVANVAEAPRAPAGFAAAYANNISSGEEPNVGAIVTKIELGEGDAAIVYATDAAASTDVETIEVPEEVNVRATYAGVVVKASPHAVEAQSFFDWLRGAEGASVLQGLGFLAPPE